MFAQFAIDPRILENLSDAPFRPAAKAFVSDRRACIVGKVAADKYKIKVGDR